MTGLTATGLTGFFVRSSGGSAVAVVTTADAATATAAGELILSVKVSDPPPGTK